MIVDEKEESKNMIILYMDSYKKKFMDRKFCYITIEPMLFVFYNLVEDYFVYTNNENNYFLNYVDSFIYVQDKLGLQYYDKNNIIDLIKNKYTKYINIIKILLINYYGLDDINYNENVKQNINNKMNLIESILYLQSIKNLTNKKIKKDEYMILNNLLLIFNEFDLLFEYSHIKINITENIQLKNNYMIQWGGIDLQDYFINIFECYMNNNTYSNTLLYLIKIIQYYKLLL